MSFGGTAKVFQLGKAPGRIDLVGDRRQPESAQHIIEFPGGAIELTRTGAGEYWAHIIINRREVVDDAEGRVSTLGRVVGTRVFREDSGLGEIDDHSEISQIAVLVARAES